MTDELRARIQHLEDENTKWQVAVAAQERRCAALKSAVIDAKEALADAHAMLTRDYPRLTAKVLSGLTQLAGLVEAGGSAEILGYDEDQLDTNQKRDWDQINTACAWIRGMQRYRRKGE